MSLDIGSFSKDHQAFWRDVLQKSILLEDDPGWMTRATHAAAGEGWPQKVNSCLQPGIQIVTLGKTSIFFGVSWETMLFPLQMMSLCLKQRQFHQEEEESINLGEKNPTAAANQCFICAKSIWNTCLRSNVHRSFISLFSAARLTNKWLPFHRLLSSHTSPFEWPTCGLAFLGDKIQHLNSDRIVSSPEKKWYFVPRLPSHLSRWLSLQKLPSASLVQPCAPAAACSNEDCDTLHSR